MTWIYRQSSGLLSHNGVLINKARPGYSGYPPYTNRPEAEARPFVGPIPVGKYKIGHPEDYKKGVGNYAMRLEPMPGTQTYGRNKFLIHGDSKDHPGLASEGCIILDLIYRHRIAESRDTTLEVIR